MYGAAPSSSSLQGPSDIGSYIVSASSENRKEKDTYITFVSFLDFPLLLGVSND